MDRRRFLKAAASSGTASWLAACTQTGGSSAPSLEALDLAASAPVLLTDSMNAPVTIESIRPNWCRGLESWAFDIPVR
jgi:hypothetical protein